MGIFAIWIFSSALLACCIVSAVDNENINILVNVDPDSKTYHQFKTREGSFNYGYNVAKTHFNQFQHKVKGPDDVTYGCYGFVDPKNHTHLYHYVSDLKGYRIVAFNQTTKIYRERVADSVKQLLQAVEESLSWDQLFFPEVCRYLYLSQKESNQFLLPEGVTVRKDGSVIVAPIPNTTSRPIVPARPVVTSPKTTQAPRPTPTPKPSPKPTPKRTYSDFPSNTASKPVDNYPRAPTKNIATSPRTTPASPRTTPKQNLNAPPSKVYPKPAEIHPKATQKPHENSILNLATTQSETVLDPTDLYAIGQDIQEVKSTLKKLFNHLLSRNVDCNQPSALGPGPGSSFGSHPNDVGPVSNADVGVPGRTLAAYLPIIVGEFAHGVASSNLGAIPEGGSVKLALPAYPAFHSPQCPVCRSDKNKK
ncbi:probable serine/threonine-protein kinase nek3 [Malaya genurostris]|uniref:probable serine/threonine-protein kinase nek3 n=1 Tax=Malaya genurostris TaxID=325434 RepID=UPI0026F38163|nr:probable serine/threonine-protein kinase nek3 [Malaya genurostris]